MEFRPSAVPLITLDPFFSIWSFSDNLYDDYTRHWTGRTNPMCAGVVIDDVFYTIMGVENPNNDFLLKRSEHLKQVSLSVKPLKTTYVFANAAVKVTLDFISPLLPDKLDILSRTVSYIEYNIETIDEKEHKTKFLFGISSECCVDNWKQNILFYKTENSLCCGNAIQNVFAKSADNACIEWGYLHIADKNAKAVDWEKAVQNKSIAKAELCSDRIYNAFGEKPYLAVEKSEKNSVIILGYDEVKSIEYFGRRLDEYYIKYFNNFSLMLDAAVKEYDKIKVLCDELDAKVISETSKFGENYEKITSLAFRQAVAAHKLAADTEGNIIFLSKECYSNGCIGTLDVTYPSMPLFLKYNPELVLGMLRPIIKYAQSYEWQYEFAPHDVGRYPLANGQVYGDNKIEYQMPIEECGNFILCVAAVTKATGSMKFADEHRNILKKWVDYLVSNGYDPGNQLCTDDFAGHLAHNCNLSLKAILAIAAYGKLFNYNSYINIAKRFAEKWSVDAMEKGTAKLAFDKENTWSLKYNIVWDKMLGINIFNEKIFENEIKLYTEKLNKYGVPLDSRKDYTKLDWLVWTTVMTDNDEYFNKVISSIFDMINDTQDRVPMTDWYYTTSGRQKLFQNRSVVGGIFINLLDLK